MKILVLMLVYNGEKYIREQLGQSFCPEGRGGRRCWCARRRFLGQHPCHSEEYKAKCDPLDYFTGENSEAGKELHVSALSRAGLRLLRVLRPGRRLGQRQAPCGGHCAEPDKQTGDVLLRHDRHGRPAQSHRLVFPAGGLQPIADGILPVRRRDRRLYHGVQPGASAGAAAG